MEYNIERSSSVGMFKKQRKLHDGKVIWDSVVKLRKKSTAECSKFPKKHLGVRNSWIKEFSNMLSEKASSYVLETMCTERTSRQEEIAQTLLSRFNNFLEQEASMDDPQTLTHKAMVTMADKLSLWLDKNVKVSKNVGIRLRQIEEEEKKKRLMEEVERLEQERRDREEKEKEKKRKMAEPKSASEIMHPPSESDPGSESPKMDEGPSMETETDGEKLQEDETKPSGEGASGEDGQQDQELQPPPPSTDSADGAQKTEGPTEDEIEITEGSQEGKLGDARPQESTTDDDKEGDKLEEEAAESAVPYDREGVDKDVTETLEPSKEEYIKLQSEEFVEPDVPDDSPIRNLLGEAEEQSDQENEEEILSSYPAPDVVETPLETLGDTQSEVPEDVSVPPSSDTEFSDRDDMTIEPSKDSDALVEEVMGSGRDDKDLVDDQELVDTNVDGESVDEKTDMVLHELAEMIAKTREEHSPLQEVIKDIMEKELEERLGDKDVESINEVAGKVGTWMDKMVERAAEEYGERRPSPVRSVSPRAVGLPTDGFGASDTQEVVAHSPPSMPETTAAKVVPPEGLAESPFSSSRQPPVSQKPKGPIFELRKVDTKNIFNVKGVTHTKAKRKIREARGQSISSRRLSQESLDVEEWAEWAGLVSDVGRNWAQWIEEVVQGVEKPENLSHDAREWKSINKKLQREGDVWMKKVLRKQSKQKSERPSKSKTVSA